MILRYFISFIIPTCLNCIRTLLNGHSLFFFPQVIDKSFGFDTAVEEAQRAINAAHVEAESVENGIGVVKLMGRHSGKIHSL